jgi:hypothetical protein
MVARQQEAYLLAGRFADRAGHPAEARRLWSRAATLRRDATLAERITAAEARARCSFAEGNHTATLRACNSGLRLIERHLVALAASDLRASATGRGTTLAGLGVDVAWQRRDPRLLFRWTERWRAAAQWLAPVRPSSDERLAELLGRLRAEVAAAQAAERDDEDGRGAARQRVAELEGKVQAVSRGRQAGRQRLPSEPRAALRQAHDALGDRALVELVEHRGQLAAVILAGGHTRLRPLGGLDRFVAHAEMLRFSLRRLVLAADDRVAAHALVAARSHLGHLCDVVGQPLRGDLDDRELVVVPDRLGHNLPWGLILGAGRPTTIAPSASLWHRAEVAARVPVTATATATATAAPATTATAAVPAGGAVTVVAGPGLEGAEVEARRVAVCHTDVRLLVGRAANAAAVAAAFDGARIAHVAAHGSIRRDNPLFSSIAFADGPMNVHDLERLRRPPTIMVLATCHSALGRVEAGNDVLGLTAALLTAGSRAVIASVLPLPDGEVVDLMVRLHQHLAAGRRPAAALAAAAAEEARSERLSFLAGTALACFGAG